MEASMKRPLWVISDDLEAVASKIIDAGGELTDELAAELEAMEGEFTDKVERVALYIRMLERNAAGAKVEKDRLAAIQKANETAASGLKSYLLSIMAQHGRDKIETYKARVTRVANSRPAVRWTGDTYDEIPEPFKRTRVVNTIDADAVLAAENEGQALDPRIEIERGHHIRIS